MSEIDEYTGKPYEVDVGHVLAARKLWKKYYDAPGSSERAFIHVIAPVLAALSVARPEETSISVPRDLWDEIVEWLDNTSDVRDTSEGPAANGAMYLRERVTNEVKEPQPQPQHEGEKK